MSYKPIFSPFKAALGLHRNCIWDKDGDLVAELSEEHDDSDTAHLLAAAPELYEALEYAIQWIPMQVIACNGLKCREPHCESCNSEEEAEAAVQQAAKELDICRAALAKAHVEQE